MAAIARDLGVAVQTLHHGVQQARIPDGSGAGLSPGERDELVRLRRQVQTLEREREIHQNATAFCAKETLEAAINSLRRRRPAIRSRCCVGYWT